MQAKWTNEEILGGREENVSNMCCRRVKRCVWVFVRVLGKSGALWLVLNIGSSLKTYFHSLLPPSSLSLTYECPLPWGAVTEFGMWGYHLLFINTGSGNAPHCQPNPLSLHLVPWQGGGGVRAAVTRYRAPDGLWIRMMGVFTPFQVLQHVCWWSRCVTACIGSCYSSGFCPATHLFFLPFLS